MSIFYEIEFVKLIIRHRKIKVEVFDEIESIDTQYAGKIKAVTDELWQIKAQLELV